MNTKVRIFFLFIWLALMFTALAVRLYFIQIRSHARFDDMTDNNYTVQVKKTSPFRGTIYDRTGQVLAINRHTYSIGFNFSHNSLSPELKKDLILKLGLTKSELDKMEKDSGSFKWLGRHVSPEKVQALFKYKSDGLVMSKENSRFYPKSPIASKIIGCVGTDNQGLSGIEYNFDNQLSDGGTEQEMFRDAKGRLIRLEAEDSKENDTADIYLTIDSNLQYILERELKEGFKKYKPVWAAAVLQNPHNGEILAIAEYPAFDNNEVPNDISTLKSKAVTAIFEPGSTFKVVTAAAALEEGLVKPDEIIDCENGEYEVGGFPIRDFEPHKKLSFEDCMVHSSNIALAKIGDRLGSKLLYKYARDFGFGNYTSIRLPGEPRGILRKPDRWSGTSLSRISFGQEIGVTSLQLVSAFSAIANGGSLYEARIIKKVEKRGKSREYQPLLLRKAVSPETCSTLNEILKEVVKRGSGVQAQVKGYKISGKTGTAQKYDPDTQTYYENKYVALFGGYFPSDKPEFTLVVLYDEPEVDYHWGGYVAAPVFSKIASAVLNYMNIAPTEL